MARKNPNGKVKGHGTDCTTTVQEEVIHGPIPVEDVHCPGCGTYKSTIKLLPGCVYHWNCECGTEFGISVE